MERATVNLPQLVAPPRARRPQENVPQTRVERELVLRAVRDHARRRGLVPPVPMDALRTETTEALKIAGLDPRHTEFAAVLLSNELWREGVAAVPFARRLLLLPKCLRLEEHCPAPFDEFGLLCKKCGLCSIQDLQVEAEKLGYAVLVAEGSPLVMALIETGKIDAIVGVSCLNVLEKVYPYMEAAAVPGVALPLLQDDCKDTSVDLDWVWDAVHMTSADRTRRLDLTALRTGVDAWFTRDALSELLGKPTGETEELGHATLSRAGKRWRPFLTVALHQALSADPMGPLSADLRRTAVAVECFHKASLIHDDIEDEDPERDGAPTLHATAGLPVALNVGDYLVGEGYRLLATLTAPAEVRAAVLQVAATGHRTLTLGQGAELSWARAPRPLGSLQVLDIFRQKTAPAFSVALSLGARLAGAGDTLDALIERYSEALGIAYQVRDDLADATSPNEWKRPTLPLALAAERAHGEDRSALRRVWTRDPAAPPAEAIVTLLERTGALARTRELGDAYREEAIRSLSTVENANVKGLLRRVVGKIFHTIEIKGWCHEFETGNAPGGPPLATPAGPVGR